MSNKFLLISGQKLTSQKDCAPLKYPKGARKMVYLEYVGKNEKNKSGRSSKFWMGWIVNDTLFFRYGSLKDKETSKIKNKVFNYQPHADNAIEEIVRKKIMKGYIRLDPKKHLS